MNDHSAPSDYFPHTIQIALAPWNNLGLQQISRAAGMHGLPAIIFYRQLAHRLNRGLVPPAVVHASHLALYATLLKVMRHIIDEVAEQHHPGILVDALRQSGFDPLGSEVSLVAGSMVELYPPAEVLAGTTPAPAWLEGDRSRLQMTLREIYLLRLAAANPALDSFRVLFDDQELAERSPYRRITAGMDTAISTAPILEGLGCTLGEALWRPIRTAPLSLAGQLALVKEQWGQWLPPELTVEVEIAFDILHEEERERGWGGDPGPPPVMEFGRGGTHGGMSVGDGASIFGGYDYPEHEAFSADADWMPNVVLMAKMVYVWLGQLSKEHGLPITRLDQVPDSELDLLARRGFTGLWLIGVWERSVASQRIKQLCGNPDAIASAYSLYDYEIAADLGGWEALASLRERAGRRGIRLASDMVPNHTGIYSRWVLQHPDWFVQTDYPPFPTYQFNGENLSHSDTMVIQVEDGYWTRTDAAVVFRMIEHSTGRCRYIYHGNDGTSIPWNDTAQLNYLLPEVREAVIQTILHVARNFPIIRFDAAMTLAKKHYQRLWFPIRGLGGGIPSRAEHGMTRDEFDALFPVEFWREVVDRVASEAPGTLLLAEAFWLMEGYFVRTLGMHRVYNSAFMNMLKKEENGKYRQTIRNVLEFNPEVLQRFVNFMNNPDEKTAVEQFGSQGKYFGACLLLCTMPGLPMFGHGQIEGFHEKYGMEYKRAYWDEQVDQGLVRGHDLWIFPILKRRWLFSGAENFALFDFYAGEAVDENVFAYSNRAGDHRALVLYHNCHARTAGWIRESAAFAVKTGNGDETLLKRTTLGEALAISGDDGVFYAFRDHTRGLEYLRNGRELHEKGIFAELGEYEFHVFMDFRELRDDVDGWWGRLYSHLNGSGVESLADEQKQLRHAEVNRAFKTALLPQRDDRGKRVKPEVQASVRAALQALDDSANVPRNRKSPLDTRAAMICDLACRIGDAAGALPKEHTREPLFTPGCALPLMMAWLLLREAEEGTMERLGLDCTLRRALDADSALRAPALVSALCGMPPGMPVEGFFSLEAARSYLQVHESGGIEWFNKECFELLAAWNTITGLIGGGGALTAARRSAAAALLQRQCELAALSGYRVKVMIGLVTNPPPAPAVALPGSGKPARKKNNTANGHTAT